MHGEAGNYKEAFHYMRNYSGLTLHMYNIEAQRTREELETQMRLKENRFELEKTQKENEKKDAEIRAGNAALQNIRMQKALLFGGLGLVALFGLFMLNRYRVIRKQRQEIEKKNTETEYQKHLVEEKNKEILDSIHYAKRIQAAILPPARIVKEYLPESFILYKPKDIVAGDFYWMESPPKGESEGTVLFAAADCTGHGVPGAMVSVVCNNGLNRSVREHGLTDPGKILDKTRDIVIAEFEKSDEDVKDGMDISLVALTHIGTDSHLSLQWAGANNPLWIIRNGEVLETKADKQPIGKYSDPKPFTTHTIDLQKGDAIYIFTDGFQDQFGGEKGKKFKAANLKQLLLTLQHETMDRQRELLADAFENWRAGYEQIDDVCVIGVRL
jgi:serine phosphatase RsbU (regulator of sigma subunit)